MLRTVWRLSIFTLLVGTAASCAATPPSARSTRSSTSAPATTVQEQSDSSGTEKPRVGEGDAAIVTTTARTSDLQAWPLTGTPGDNVGDWPVLVVKIDNHERARPQFGVNSADVVFEEIVEGGLTRFAALYHSKEAGLVGPIRSVRTSDFDLLENLNRPLFANSGGNEAVLQLLQEVDFTDAEIGMVVGGFNTYSDLVANFEADLAEEVGEEAAACMAETLGFSVLNEVLRATFADDVAALERTSDSFSIAADFCGLS